MARSVTGAGRLSLPVYVLRAATREVKVMVDEVRWRLDVNIHARDHDAGEHDAPPVR